MLLNITSNNVILYESSLIFFKIKCGLNTGKLELRNVYKNNSYIDYEEYTNVMIPTLDVSNKYELEYNDNKITLYEEKKNEIFVANIDRKMMEFKILYVEMECEEMLSDLSKAISKFKNNLFMPEKDLIAHYICNEFCDWEKSDSYDKRNIDTLYLSKDVKNDLFDDVNNFYNNEDIQNFYVKMGIPQSRIYLFYGHHGTGKTTSCYSIASYLKMNIGTIDFTNSIDDCKLRKCFKSLPDNTILLLEDLDHLFAPKKGSDEMRHSITFSGLLNILDGINRVKKLICIVTCNNIESLDKTLLRRIDYSIPFTNVISEDQITEFCNEIPIDFDKTKVINFFKNKSTTINIIQKWVLLHLNKLQKKEYYLHEKLNEFNEFDKWYMDITIQNYIYN
jgi:energy-coupling factor transporter ATP-binding protein EcfA2